MSALNNKLAGFIEFNPAEHRQHENLAKSFGSLNASNTKKWQTIKIGLKTIEAGFDDSKRYLLLWNPETQQIGLKEDAAGYRVGIHPVKNKSGTFSVTRQIQAGKFCEVFKIQGNFRFTKVEKIENAWVFDLELKTEKEI